MGGNYCVLCVHHLHGNVGSVRRHLHGRIPVRDADSVCLYSHSRLVSRQARRHGDFSQNLAPELSTPYLDGGIVGDIITYFVFTLAGAEMWQRAFAAKSQKAAKKEGLFLGTFVYGLTIPLVWFMGVVAHQLVPAEKDHRLRLDRRGGSGAGNRNSSGGTHGSGAGGHFVRHHVDGGQLSDRLRADLRPRYL